VRVEFNGDDSVQIGKPEARLCDPGRPIPPSASAVHHLRDRDVAGQPTPDKIFPEVMAGADVFCAHKSDFDRQFFGGGDKPWLCTWKGALRVWPDAPSHSNQALRYWRGFDDDPAFDRSLVALPHRAGCDAYVTAHILRDLLGLASLGDLQRWSSGPALLTKVGFGKHFGKRWSEVDKSYLEWITEKSDIKDRDVRATAKYYLKGGGK
jgi:exodeoxyribonuclease X